MGDYWFCSLSLKISCSHAPNLNQNQIESKSVCCQCFSDSDCEIPCCWYTYYSLTLYFIFIRLLIYRSTYIVYKSAIRLSYYILYILNFLGCTVTIFILSQTSHSSILSRIYSRICLLEICKFYVKKQGYLIVFSN